MKTVAFVVTRCSHMASEIANPSFKLDPLPNSSIITRLFSSTSSKIQTISFISVAKLEVVDAKLSTQILVFKLLKIGKFAYSAGTNEPICAMMDNSATCLK